MGTCFAGRSRAVRHLAASFVVLSGSIPVFAFCEWPFQCDDHNQCTIDRCEEARDLCFHDPVPPGTPCNGACSTGGTCSGTTCTGGTPIVCNDGDPCTRDHCEVAEGGCVYTPDVCDDGDACTTDTCGAEGACSHGSVTCADQNPCTDDSCVPPFG